jgi:hypothetical protein
MGETVKDVAWSDLLGDVTSGIDEKRRLGGMIGVGWKNMVKQRGSD